MIICMRTISNIGQSYVTVCDDRGRVIRSPGPVLDSIFTDPSQIKESQWCGKSGYHTHIEGQRFGCGFIGYKFHEAR